MATIHEKMENVVIDPTEFNSKNMTQLYNIGCQIGKHHINRKEKISFDEYDNNR
ncbi:hypothetical protein [Sulfurimonas sp.]|uniref:hypothetical protein n=1 Tax=Sulfurimonas sp. TaxID=2022749 RepID=UPI003567C1D2